MLKLLAIQCVLFSILCDAVERKPLYKYRYETEDVMKTAETSVPVHGYHVVEGGYYPGEIGFGSGVGGGGISSGIGGGSGEYIGSGGFGGSYTGSKTGGYGGEIGLGGAGIGLGSSGLGIGSGIGYSGGSGSGGIGYSGGSGSSGIGYSGGLGYSGGFGGGGIGLGGSHYIAPLYHGYGGEDIKKNVYSGGKKNLNDEKYEKIQGKKGEEINHGQEGYSQGKVAVKDVKGDSGYFSDVGGGKNLYEDGKQYHGSEHFDEGGNKGAEEKEKKGHKKGHVIKGFKTSHHKDESGKTEEFYDEEHDEGGHSSFNGESGSFGKSSASSFKGGHQDGKFNSGEHKKEGHYDNEHVVDKSNADQGKYGEKKYAGNNAIYGLNNGIDQQSLLGHQESNHFYKHSPHYVPFYHHHK